MNSDLALVSLFAGVGGFDLAAANIGIPTIAAVEIDDHARGVLKHRFPTTNLFTDVKEVTGSDLRAGFMGRVILCGGFPCQDLSIAGKRAGLAGGRSGLFWEIIRIAEEIDAEAVVLENVPGLISSNGGRDFGTVIGALAELGYRVGWRVLDAQHFGVPQRRRRIFITATRVGTDTLAEILFESESSSRDPETGDETRQNTTADTTDSAGTGRGIDVLAFSAGNSDKAFGIGLSENVTPPLRASSSGTNQTPTVVYDDTTDSNGRDAIGFNWQNGGGYGNANPGLAITENGTGPLSSSQVIAVAYPIREDAVAGNFSATEIDTSLCLQAQQPSPQSHHAQTFIAQQVAAYDEFNDAIGDTHHTLRAGTKQSTGVIISESTFPLAIDLYNNSLSETNQSLRAALSDVSKYGAILDIAQAPAVTDQTIVRRLTPMECERLQGFPDGWTTHRHDFKKNTVVEQADSARYKQMGNAVAVPVVQWLLTRLAVALDA